MKYSYYPGCSLRSSAAEYDESMRDVLAALGIQVEELQDWSCCGATAAHATDEFLSIMLPLRNLVLAEASGYDVLMPCAACYNVFRKAEWEIRQNTEHGKQANKTIKDIMGATFRGTVTSVHPLEVLAKPEMVKLLKSKVKVGLHGMKVAPYYGCLLVRPSKIVAFEDPEQPTSIDKLLKAVGAEVVQWSYKTDCCGGGLTVAQTSMVAAMSDRIVTRAIEAGAQAIATACPMCHSNLDTRQSRNVPIFFFSELLGLAMGLSSSFRCIKRHMVDPMPLIEGIVHGTKLQGVRV